MANLLRTTTISPLPFFMRTAYVLYGATTVRLGAAVMLRCWLPSLLHQR